VLFRCVLLRDSDVCDCSVQKIKVVSGRGTQLDLLAAKRKDNYLLLPATGWHYYACVCIRLDIASNNERGNFLYGQLDFELKSACLLHSRLPELLT